MSLFEKATRLKLRFSTDRGLLSVEQLWDLTLAKLNTLAKSLNKDLKASKEEDFLDETTEEDAELKLKFDVVRYIMEILKEEKKQRQDAKSISDRKQYLLRLKQQRQEEQDQEMSVEDIDAELAKLG